MQSILPSFEISVREHQLTRSQKSIHKQERKRKIAQEVVFPKCYANGVDADAIDADEFSEKHCEEKLESDLHSIHGLTVERIDVYVDSRMQAKLVPLLVQALKTLPPGRYFGRGLRIRQTR